MTPEKRGAHGFTLVEVLIALAIIAFGLIGVFGQLSQSATAAARLRDKTLASWVAMNQLTQLRLSGEYPGVGTHSDEVEMANRRWRYEISISETQGDYLRRADVTVAFAEDPDRPIATAVGFLARPPAGGAVSTTGWPVLTGEEQPGTTAPPPPPASPAPAGNQEAEPIGMPQSGGAEE